MIRPVVRVSIPVLAIALIGCDGPGPAGPRMPAPLEPELARGVSASQVDARILSMMNDANRRLERAGAPYRAAYAEWIAGPGGGEQIGRTVYFGNVGNKRLGDDFVPGDPRRGWSVGGEITYLVDQSDGATFNGLTSAQTEAAIDRAMATWNAETCSELSLRKVEDDGSDPDLVDGLLGFGTLGTPRADITHAGWVTAFAQPVLGVTFTLIWIDGEGNPTDIDGNDMADVAFREIYYSNLFVWNIGDHIDVETVALHEAGHGLSQAHFGTLFSTDANGFFHFAPRAVMNAGYTGIQQTIGETDRAGHCGNWASWPQT